MTANRYGLAGNIATSDKYSDEHHRALHGLPEFTAHTLSVPRNIVPNLLGRARMSLVVEFEMC